MDASQSGLPEDAGAELHQSRRAPARAASHWPLAESVRDGSCLKSTAILVVVSFSS